MEQDKKNVEDLRDLIENLLMLSFDQEELRDEVKTLKIGDPLLNKKAQQQKKIREDMEMVKDSLYSLAKRSVQIEKLLTDETNRIIDGISEAPIPGQRAIWMSRIPNTFKKFVTIEPVLDFDVEILGQLASSQTVCSFFSFNNSSDFVFFNKNP
jgi:hypothetical protein